MPLPPPRPIKRFLVANRGEIALRILQAAHELPTQISTFALYTKDDHSHIDLGRPHHALLLPSPASYLDINLLIQLAKEHGIDTVHPGYGFLSESAEFAKRMWVEAGATVIGPGWEALDRTGDKVRAKELAQRCGVPVLQSMDISTGGLEETRAFAADVGYPVMVKAVDGGGGRGIRLVWDEKDIHGAVARAMAESPSNTVFVEKAAVDGFHHVEVQIVGDGNGEVRHLWERDCSVQRRFQKVVDCAPGMVRNRGLIAKIVDAAVRIAREINYLSLGTFEFLVNEHSSEFYFLEVNPRLQVEHTITECITGVDLVQTQLLLAQGYSLNDVGLETMENTETAPRACSIQLRLCAEDPNANLALSIGKVTEMAIPTGNGVRVDTHVSSSSPVIVGSDFDNLLAKIIVTASSWEGVVRKAERVLEDSRISGVKTNIDLLRGTVAHEDFKAGRVDTQWLEKNLADVIRAGNEISKSGRGHKSSASTLQSAAPSAQLPRASLSSTSTPLLRKGDAWSIILEPLPNSNHPQNQIRAQNKHHLLLTRLLRNDFPSSLSAEIEYTSPSSPSQPPSTNNYTLHLSSTSSALLSHNQNHRLGDPSDPTHIILPLSGKLIEMLVEPGDDVREGEVVAFVRQMKMEVEVRSHRRGRVKWVLEIDEEAGGEDVGEGVLVVELEGGNEAEGVGLKGRMIGVKGKL